MSDRARHINALRQRVEKRHGPIREQEVPETPEGLVKLARSDPDRFNALMEAGRIPRSALGAEKGQGR